MDYENREFLPEWDESDVYADERLLADGWADDESYDEKEALEAPKAGRYRGLCYMARYSGATPLIAQIKGQKIVAIYRSRGYVEISYEEYKQLAKSIREGRE